MGGQLEVLLVFFRAVVAAREREDQRIAALELAERADRAGSLLSGGDSRRPGTGVPRNASGRAPRRQVYIVRKCR